MRPISVAILVGGRSSRFGSTPKALAHFRGRTVIEHQLAALVSNATRVALIGDRLSAFDDLIEEHGLDRVADAQPEVGPMAGLVAALEWSPTPWLFVAAADLPQVDWRIVEALEQALEQGLEQGLEDGNPPHLIAPVVDSRVQPLAALYNHQVLEVVKQCLEQRLLSPRRLFESANAKRVNLDPALASLLRGFNTVSELRELEKSTS